DIYLRESEGVTGIGEGIAIPHGKSIAVKDTTVAIATLKNEIEWETLDGENVKVVILFAVKDTDATTTHIVLLQKVATLLARDTFIKKLKNINTKDELYDLIINS
ncbi:PTS sugar transporter subunit IIA, partial [Mammaliicoccus vitulinus]